MLEIDRNMNEIHRRFVQGILSGFDADQLHAFVTGRSAQESPEEGQ